MVRRGLIGRIAGRGRDEIIGLKLSLGNWHGREKLPSVRRNQIHIPLSEAQLAKLDQYVRDLRKQEKGLDKPYEGPMYPYEKYPGYSRGIGNLGLTVNHSKKHMWWDGFEPFLREIFTKPYPTNIPAGVGIGDLVHYAAVKHLAAKYKGYTISHDASSVSPERVKQLARMGIDVEKTYKIREYHDRVRDYIEKVRRQKQKRPKKSTASRGFKLIKDLEGSFKGTPPFKREKDD